MNNNNDLIIITGCDSGIGKNTAKILSTYNYKIIITYLEKNPFSNIQNISAYKLDLRNENSILSFVNKIKTLCKQRLNLKYLINNAGVALACISHNVIT
jgi:NADP-dependent 3-hydroxy acid dehydrogenase YdfG